jgi:hypothetical protein
VPLQPNPDQLTSAPAVKGVLGIAQNDPSFDTLLGILINEASALIGESLNRDVLLASNAANPITEFPVARGGAWLMLDNAPIQAPILTGTTVAGSAVVTGLSSTRYLFPGQCVSGVNLASQGSFILSVDSASQVTLNAPATASGTGSLVFGMGLWLDNDGYYGSVPGSFGAGTQLFEGSDFAIPRDDTGMILRRNGVWNVRYTRERDDLSGQQTTGGVGNIKAIYCAGWPSVPGDLALACERVIAKARRTTAWGELLQTQSYEGASWSAVQNEMRLGLLGGDVAPILARRRLSGLGV